MDYSMPLCSGPQAAKAILEYLSAYPEVQRPYICCLTAYNTIKFREEAKKSGMDDFYNKIMNRDDMEKIIKAANIIT